MELRARVYENPLKYTRKRSPSPRPQMNRIYSPHPPKGGGGPPIVTSSLSPMTANKENLLPRPGATKFVSYATKTMSAGSTRLSPSIRSPDENSSHRPSTLPSSNSLSTDTKPLRSILISSPSVPPHAKRRCELSGAEHKTLRSSDQVKFKNHRTLDVYTPRYAQGHKTPSRSRSVSRVAENAVTTQDFDCHRREVHAVVSTLGSRVTALEDTIAAALPVVVEARLLWMENAIVRTPEKLGITRQSFCECYGSPRYDIYTRRIRTRAHHLGLTLDDLEYLQERLDSLGSQSANQDTLLISPFGGTNKSGDKTMVEAYRRDSKHGAYARRIWRACYESAYSVDENWMLPIPTPDSLTLVEKFKSWLHGS